MQIIGLIAQDWTPEKVLGKLLKPYLFFIKLKKFIFCTLLLLSFLSVETVRAALSPVKSTVVINSLTVNGPALNNGDNYGFAAAPLGDLDGDSVPDIVVGAWANDTGGTNRGAVYISFLNSDGSVKSTVPINSLTANGPVLSDSDGYGISVNSLGDLDGDGVTDIIVGTWASDVGGLDRGAVHIHFLNTDGSVKSTVQINGLTPNGPVLNNSDIYGVAVSKVGDLDGDGVTEIMVGALRDDTGGTNRGAVYIHFMNSNGSVKSTTKITSLTSNGPTLINNNEYGRSLNELGDLDGDGIPDIAVSTDTDGVGSRGAVYIHFLKADGSVKSTSKINTLTVNGPILNDNDRYGLQVASLGDLDGDGVKDLGVGAYLDDAGGTNRGTLHIHLMNSNGSVKSTREINSLTVGGPFLNDNDSYGTSVASLGDLDKDGISDIAVGAYASDAGGLNRGAVHIHLTNSFVMPPAPIVLTPPAGSTVYNNQTPTFTGTGTTPGNDIIIKDGATLIGTGKVLPGGSWSVTSSVTLPYAPYSFSVYESSVLDGPAVLHGLNLVADLSPPVTPVTAPDLKAASDLGISSSDDLTSDNTPDFDIACSEISSTIRLYSDNPAAGTLIGTHVCTSVGTESLTSASLPDGIHNVSYSEEDPAGNVSGFSPALAISIDTVPPAPISVISVGGSAVSPYYTTDTTPDVVLNTVIGDTVTIVGFSCVPTPAVGASVTCTSSSVYSSSPQTISIAVTDSAGNGPTTGSVIFNINFPSQGGGSGWYNPAPVLPASQESVAVKKDGEVSVLPKEPQSSVSCLKQNKNPEPFSDIGDHFARNAIMILSKTMSDFSSITEGYVGKGGEKIFKPDQWITRAEFLKMAMLSNCMTVNKWLLKGDKISSDSSQKQPSKLFRDIALDSEAWYVNYVYSGLEAGIVNGELDGNFYPDRPITRAEAVKILVNIQQLIKGNYAGSNYFSDIFSDDWYFKFVSAGKENNLIYGYNEDGKNVFRPLNNITRGETALILVRIFDLRDFLVFKEKKD